MIINDYLANYESVLKDTVLYDEAAFQEMKDEMDEAFEEQKEEYESMKYVPLVEKDTFVDFLKNYRDTLRLTIDSYAKMLEVLP